jgi:hypothetical protein
VIPYGLASSAAALRNVPIPLAIVALLQFLQGVIFVGVAAGLGLLISGRLGLGAPLLQAWLYKDRTYDARWRFGSSAGIGVVVGAVVALLAHFVFLPRIPQLLATDIDIAQWKRLLACFYGGINEEILMRLFLLSLVLWGLSKLWRDHTDPAVFGPPIWWSRSYLGPATFLPRS